MGLFSRKKETKEEPNLELPPLKFPEFSNDKNVPAYESSLGQDEAATIKQAVEPVPQPAQPAFTQVQRPTPTFTQKPVAEPAVQQDSLFDNSDSGETEEEVVTQKPASVSSYKRDDKMFVQIDKYEDAISKIDKIKAQLEKADTLLSNLEELKKQEDEEMANWRKDLDNIKNKILEIDKTLFEG